MHSLLLALFLNAPFWEARPPAQWSEGQMLQLLEDSPWGQAATLRGQLPVWVYLATAQPMRMLEAEARRRAGTPSSIAREEYEAFLRENEGKVIVLAVRKPNLEALAEAGETRRMEQESVLRVGKQKLRVTGHFPPVDSDPVLRLVFPRPAQPGKELKFELYLPGAAGSYRDAYFPVKDMTVGGRTEM